MRAGPRFRPRSPHKRRGECRAEGGIPKLFDLRNRLFFMANDEWKSQRQNSKATYSVMTPAMFTGDFGAFGTTIYDPNTGANGARYWNLDAFTEAPPGQFGNAGRNAIHGPGIIGFDAEIHKQFRQR
jgi:hypothetical protein